MSDPTADRPLGSWWGWSRGGPTKPLSPEMLRLIEERFGSKLEAPAASIKPADTPIPEPQAMGRAFGGELGSLIGTGPSERLAHSAGMSYPDLIALRTGQTSVFPDGVAFPRNPAQVDALIGAASRHGVAIIPFGGGTSVVGGVTPRRGSHRSVLSMDLTGVDSMALDEVSQVARFGPGVQAPAAEKFLRERGLTLGHFPQSFERASIGGFAATRSAGQASSGYGRFDELVTGISMSTPIGPLESVATPHSAAGPDLREIAVGSEGTLGIITSVSCRVVPAPRVNVFGSWMCEGFEAGMKTVRRLAQADSLPDIVRLSDEEETSIGLSTSGAPSGVKRMLDAWLGVRQRRGGALLICGWSGSRDSVGYRRRLAKRLIRGTGGLSLGSAPGNSWSRSRFEGPYLRDHMIDLGILVDTLETAHIWRDLPALYHSTREAIRANLGPAGIVMCHLSHAYRDGASLYFTFLAAVRPGDEIETWRRIKAAACDAIVGGGGTITHHHAVGSDHVPWMEQEVGPVGIDALRAVKNRLDPEGIMNPGVLLP